MREGSIITSAACLARLHIEKRRVPGDYFRHHGRGALTFDLIRSRADPFPNQNDYLMVMVRTDVDPFSPHLYVPALGALMAIVEFAGTEKLTQDGAVMTCVVFVTFLTQTLDTDVVPTAPLRLVG